MDASLLELWPFAVLSVCCAVVATSGFRAVLGLHRERKALDAERAKFEESARRLVLFTVGREEKAKLQGKYGGYGQELPELQGSEDGEEGT